MKSLATVAAIAAAAAICCSPTASAFAQESQAETKDDPLAGLPSHEGKVVKAEFGQLTMTLDGEKPHTHRVLRSARITLNGREVELEKLRQGDRVEVTTEKGNPRVAVAIAATREKQAERSKPESRGDVDEAERDRDGKTPQRQAAKTQNERLLGVNVTRTPGNGAFVVDVLPGSPASRAGIRVADYLLEFEGVAIESPPQLTEALNAFEKDQAELTVWRNGEELTVDANFGQPELDQPQEHARRQSPWLGVSLASKPEDDVQGARILRVFPAGPAARAGVRSGDVLQRIGETEIRSAGDVREAIEQIEVGSTTTLVVQRGEQRKELDARLGFRRAGRNGLSGESDPEDPAQFRDEYSANVPITERDVERETTRRLFEQNQRLERLVLTLIREVDDLKQRLDEGENAGRGRGNRDRNRRGDGSEN